MQFNKIVVLPFFAKVVLAVLMGLVFVYAAFLVILKCPPDFLDAIGLWPKDGKVEEGNATVFIGVSIAFVTILTVAFLDPGSWRLASFQRKFMLKTFVRYSGLMAECSSEFKFFIGWRRAFNFLDFCSVENRKKVKLVFDDVYLSGRCWYKVNKDFFEDRDCGFDVCDDKFWCNFEDLRVKLELNIDTVTIAVEGSRVLMERLMEFGGDVLVGAEKNGGYQFDATREGRRYYPVGNDKLCLIMRKKLECNDFLTNYAEQVKFSRDMRYFIEALLRVPT